MEVKILKPGVQRMMFLEHVLPQTHTACHHGLFLHRADLELELKQNYDKQDSPSWGQTEYVSYDFSLAKRL